MSQLRLARSVKERDKHDQLFFDFIEKKKVLVVPRTYIQLKREAEKVRNLTTAEGHKFITDSGRFLVEKFFSYGLDADISQEYVAPDNPILCGAHAATDLETRTMYFRENLAGDLDRGDGFARSTHMHEYAHARLHAGGNAYEVPVEEKETKFIHPEDQAWEFVREVLFPVELHRSHNCMKCSREKFGISASFYTVCCERRKLNYVHTCS